MFCGQPAPCHELRTEPLLTAVGPVEISRPYYWCPDCRAGQFSADVELDIENTEFSPGVRRMWGIVDQERRPSIQRETRVLLECVDSLIDIPIDRSRTAFLTAACRT